MSHYKLIACMRFTHSPSFLLKLVSDKMATDLWKYLFVCCIFVVFGNCAHAKNCSEFSGVNITMDQLEGMHFVQGYTLPNNMDLQVKCEKLNITVNEDMKSGTIISSFVTKDVPSEPEHNETYAYMLKATDDVGKFQYYIPNSRFIMNQTVIVFNNNGESWASITCLPSDQNSQLTIFTRAQRVEDSEVEDLLQQAIELGAPFNNFKRENQNNCSN